MDYTYLDYFNYYLKEFCYRIIANFPDYEKNIVMHYRTLLESAGQCKNDMYLKFFISKVNDYTDKIFAKDQTLFEPANYVDKESGLVSNLYFLEGVDFLSLWACSYNNQDNQQAIWKYLQLLTIIARKVVPNKAEVLELFGSIGTDAVQAPAKVEKTLLSPPDDLDDTGNKPDMFGGLAGLAGLMGGSGVTDMFKSIGDMFSGVDIAGIMDGLKNMQEAGMQPTTDSTTGNTSAEHQQSATADQPQPASASSGGMPGGMPGGNLLMDMAKEMAETLDFSKMQTDTPPANMADAFKQIFSGDNSKKITELISRMGSKVQQEFAKNMSGQDMSAMRKQAEQLMRTNPGFAEQAEQLKKQSQPHSGRAKKEQLAAKLEAKRQQQQQQQQAKDGN